MNQRVRMMVLATTAWLASGVAMAGMEHEHPPMTQTAATAQVTGTLHGVDLAKRTADIEHPAVPEFRWPAMRMNFSVAQGVKLEGLKPGESVHFTITRSEQTTFTITEMGPAH